MLCRAAPGCRATLLVHMAAAPYPYDADPNRNEPAFFQGRDPTTGEGTRSRADRTFSAGGNYADDRVLIHVPPGFDPARPFRILLFFHGHLATLRRDVVGRYDIPGQVNASGRNVILIAPQLARDAIDSHPGKLIRQNGVADLLAEALPVVARETGLDPDRLARAPVVLAGFSGGNIAVVTALERGGIPGRIAGVILMDALFSEMDRYARWFEANDQRAFLFVLYGEATERNTDELIAAFRERNLRFAVRFPAGEIAGDANFFIRVETKHVDIPSDGPPRAPLAAILHRLPPFEAFALVPPTR
ncbi:MAG: hypothetical protein KC466_21130 [Myxococcales bacterium]|nr:hypothetical protein [Myxococcales bacterium]